MLNDWPSPRASRRRLLGSLLALAAAPLFQACSSGSPSSTAPATGSQSASAPTSPAAPAPTTAATSNSAPVATKPAAKQSVQVTFATDWVSGPRGQAIKEMIPKFEQQHSDIKLKEEPIGGDYWDTVNVQFAAGTVADVQLGDGYFFNVYVLKDAYVPLDPYLKSNGIDMNNYDIVPNVATHGGQTFGMPAQLVVSGWYYNEDLFNQAGVKAPDENWTWNDVLDLATKLTDPSKKQYGILAGNSDEFGWGPLLFSNGADWRDKDNTKCLMADAGGVDAFQWYVDLIYKHKVSPAPSETKTLQGEFADPFSAGKIAIMPTGFQGIGNYMTRIAGRFKWGLLPTPKSLTTKNAYNEWNDQPYYLTSGAKKRNVLDQAAQLAIFMGGDFVQGQIAVFRGSIPTIKTLQTGDAFLKAPPDNMSQVSKNLAAPKLLQAPYLFDHGLEFQQAYNTEIDKAFTGEKPAADALRDGVAAANKILTKYAGQ